MNDHRGRPAEIVVAQKSQLLGGPEEVDRATCPGVEVSNVLEIDFVYEFVEPELSCAARDMDPVVRQAPPRIERRAKAADPASCDERFEAQKTGNGVDNGLSIQEFPRVQRLVIYDDPAGRADVAEIPGPPSRQAFRMGSYDNGGLRIFGYRGIEQPLERPIVGKCADYGGIALHLVDDDHKPITFIAGRQPCDLSSGLQPLVVFGQAQTA